MCVTRPSSPLATPAAQRRTCGAGLLEDAMFDAPISAPMAAHPNRGVFASLWLALGWPARVVAARETRARLAELSEREWQDIRPGRQDFDEDVDLMAIEDDPAEDAARVRAIRAWYGHDAKAA